MKRYLTGIAMLTAIALLLLPNLGCNGCGRAAEEAIDQAQETAGEIADSTGEAIEEGAEAVGEAAEATGEMIEEGAEAVSEGAGEVADATIEEGKEVAGEAVEAAGDVVEEAKEAKEAVEETAKELKEKG